MKKIYLLLTFAASVLFSACNMDLAPEGSLDDEIAIETVYDLQKLRNGIYNNMRSFSTGAYMYLSDIQMDEFIGTVINGNRNGSFAHGNILSGNQDIEGVWAACYAVIADCNYLLKEAEKFYAKDLTEEELLEVNRYVAETRFARAWYYSYLFDHFCEAYTADKAEMPAKGVPVVTVYNPTADSSTYPGRSTMDETFELIDSDLDFAYNALKECEEAGLYKVVPQMAYVTSYTALALQARTALWRGDWTTAIEKAQEVIDSKIYTLASTTNYASMWTNDSSNELIFVPYSSSVEQGISSTGAAYIKANHEEADYLPSAAVLDWYDQSRDVRFSTFFEEFNISANAIYYPALAFVKYPGNSSLNSGTSNDLLNRGKPFRLSELYLIVAEAAYELGDETTANDMLSTIRTNRITRYGRHTALSGDELRDAVRMERTKELIGEGFRMSDLRRWGLGFSRDGEYPLEPMVEEIFNTIDTQVEYIAGDYRYVWPIPTAELENNPQIRGQQNPGY